MTSTMSMPSELLPSYNESVTGFVPPPTYQSTSTSSPVIPINSYASDTYYHPKPLSLVVLDDSNEDPSDVSTLNIPTEEYKTKKEAEIKNLYHSICTIVEDKYVQVNRNTVFVHKKIRSMYNIPYINQLRSNTLDDFMKIKQKLKNELDSLPQIFRYYKQFNQLYQSNLDEIDAIKYELENAFDPKEQSSNEGELIRLSTLLTTKSNLNKKLRYNLHQIDSKIKDLSDTDEVNYVLKERARVYSMAKGFVENQNNR